MFILAICALFGSYLKFFFFAAYTAKINFVSLPYEEGLIEFGIQG